MSQEKYMQYYVELLTATLTDCIVRNVSMQANAKIKDEAIEQLNEKIMEFKSANDELSTVITDLKSKTDHIESQNTALGKLRNEYEALKGTVSSIDLFRNELIKERNSHDETRKQYEFKIAQLNEELEALKAPPKRKKVVKKPDVLDIVGLSNGNEVSEVVEEPVEETVKDGGTF